MTPATSDYIPTTEDRHWWFAGRTRALTGILDDLIASSAAPVEEPSGQRQVLDVGCGAGNMTHHLSRYGTVLGVDSFIRPLSVAITRGYPVAQAQAECLPVASDRFGLVAALDVVEHCDDDLGVLQECWRVVRPGGLLAVTVPAFSWLWGENDVVNGHRRRYSREQLGEIMMRAGFDTLTITCLNIAVFPLAAALIFLRNRQKRSLGLAAPSTDEAAYQVEMQPTHPVVNEVLTAIGSAEAALVRRVALPLGTGLLAVGRKPVR